VLKHIRAAAALILAAACSDTVTSPATNSLRLHQRSANYSEEGPQNPPEDAPAEFLFPTILYSVEPDAGFVDGYAWAQSIVRYFATNALARATVRTDVGDATDESETSAFLPANRDWMVSTNRYMAVCSEPIRGEAYGKIWNEFLLSWRFTTWGVKSDSRSKTAFCPPSSSGDAAETCYVVYIDHYLLYSDGHLDYMGSDRISWCDKNPEGEI